MHDRSLKASKSTGLTRGRTDKETALKKAVQNHAPEADRLSGLTKGARVVVDALEEYGDLASAQEIYGRLRAKTDKAPGLTTVYRALDILVAKGYVQSVDLGDGEKRYEVVTPGEHHHHLVCETCGQSNHLDQCVVEEIEDTIRAKYGFLIKSHVLEIFGVCKICHDSQWQPAAPASRADKAHRHDKK